MVLAVNVIRLLLTVALTGDPETLKPPAIEEAMESVVEV
jgi:hypothetical protein